jgi:hypothetical protein
MCWLCAKDGSEAGDDACGKDGIATEDTADPGDKTEAGVTGEVKPDWAYDTLERSEAAVPAAYRPASLWL